MSSQEIPEELVSVPVPRSMLPQVYALLGAGMGTPGGSQTALPGGNAGTDWSVKDFRRLIKDSRASAHTMVTVLDVLAAHPDSTLSLSDLAAEAGLTRKQLQGALSGFTRVCKSLWPDDEGSWPMAVSWGVPTVDGQGGEAHYVMDSATARVWRDARHGHS